MAVSNGTTAPKQIWATLITNVAYLPGLLVLDYSLKRAGTQYPLVALYTDALPQAGHEILDRRSIAKRRVNALNPRINREYTEDPRFKDVWTKLAIFELSEYDRVILLDSDMLVRQNMDELMDLPLDSKDLKGQGKRVFAASHACVCNPLKKPHYPEDWIPDNCAFFHQHADVERAQKEGRSNTESFGMPNSGLVAIDPCIEGLDQIQQGLQHEDTVNYKFPDQELLGDVFRERWVTLPYVYNALKPMRRKGVHDTIWRDNRLKNVHYILSPKPWNEHPEEADEVNRWWHDMNADRLEEERKSGVYDGTGDTALLSPTVSH